MINLNFLFLYIFYKISGRDLIFDRFFKGHSMLDIGCGNGEMLKKDPVNFRGIDANLSQVLNLKKIGLSVVHGDASNLPFEDNSFNSVYCSNLIEHLTPNEAYCLLSEAIRVLKPGGYLIIITPMPVSVWNTFGHIRPYPPTAIRKILRPISLEKMESLGDLKEKNLIYFGSLASNKLVFLMTTILANISGLFRGSYLMVLKKNKYEDNLSN